MILLEPQNFYRGLTTREESSKIDAMVEQHEQSKRAVWLRAFQLALELGYTIAIPIVVFALVGRFLDKKLETSPWLLIAGILVSIVVSSVGVYLKAAKMMKES